MIIFKLKFYNSYLAKFNISFLVYFNKYQL